jgi:hypothetical protein
MCRINIKIEFFKERCLMKRQGEITRRKLWIAQRRRAQDEVHVVAVRPPGGSASDLIGEIRPG